MAQFRVIHGAFYHKGNVYRVGDVVEIDHYVIRHFRDQFEPLKPEDAEPPEPEPEVRLHPVHVMAGWYDVINEATGRKINDKRLRKEDAYALAGIDDEADEAERPLDGAGDLA